MTAETAQWSTETVNASILERGKWRKEFLPLRASHVLYAWGKEDGRQSYVVTVLTPICRGHIYNGDSTFADSGAALQQTISS